MKKSLTIDSEMFRLSDTYKYSIFISTAVAGINDRTPRPQTTEIVHKQDNVNDRKINLKI
ncbi:MAG TPA: hypothetical protein QF753_13245 [Victivallales bacterium]|nr:hypothetical protein [Victivallales bacterium]